MLVLTRKEGERILVGHDVVLTVVSIRGNKIRIGVSAPPHVTVRRAELPAREPNGPLAEFELTTDDLVAENATFGDPLGIET